MMNLLRFVSTPQDVWRSLLEFNAGIREDKSLAWQLLRQTSYWVYEPSKQLFGPSKFVGFVDMNFRRYRQCRQGGFSGYFDGHDTRNAIAAALGGSYSPSLELSGELANWGEARLGTGCFNGIKSDKWRFVVLNLSTS
jgi:hypothetical protein